MQVKPTIPIKDVVKTGLVTQVKQINRPLTVYNLNREGDFNGLNRETVPKTELESEVIKNERTSSGR